jgi:hypothetical protein
MSIRQITKKKLLLILVTVALLAVSPFIAWQIYTKGKTKLTVNVAPRDAKISLNDSSIKIGANYVKPGDYTITISRNGFETYSQSISIKASEPLAISKLLSASSTEGTTYEKQHVEEFSRVADIIDEEEYTYNAYSNTEWTEQNYPLLVSLPVYMSSLFSIEYGQSEKYPNDPSKKAVIIYADTPDGKQSALMYIYSMGFDPSDYEILFKTNYATNPEEFNPSDYYTGPSEDDPYYSENEGAIE